MIFLRRLKSYFLNSAGNPNIFGKIVLAIVTIIIAKLIVVIVKKLINRTVERQKKANNKINPRRLDTIAGLVGQGIKILVYFYAVISILNNFHIDTKSILATAGIGGVAIGFGAQSLIKDVIAGFFVLQENSYVVGDYVILQDFQGYVEEMNLRITRVRAISGELYTLPNGYITEITNMSRGSQLAISMFPIAYEESVDQAMEVLSAMCEEVKREYSKILVSGPQVDGVENFMDSSYTIRVSGFAKTAQHWTIQKALNKKGKEYLDAAGIEIPYNKIEIIKD